LRPGARVAAQDLRKCFAKLDLLRFLGWIKERLDALVERAHVHAIETDQVVDAVAVIEAPVAARAVAHPRVAPLLHYLHAPRRQAPVLAGVAERIGRHADGRVEHELLLARPHVRAVA
jgi:hypothetical protein